MTISVSQRLNIFCAKQFKSRTNCLYNASWPLICEDCHFTQMWKTLEYPHHYTKRPGDVWTH